MRISDCSSDVCSSDLIADGLTPRAAAHRSMDEVAGPIIAISLVLCAVFVPPAFVGGFNGQFYQQFALVIAFAAVISAFNSLTLSPALAALLLRPHGAKPDRVQIGRASCRERVCQYV